MRKHLTSHGKRSVKEEENTLQSEYVSDLFA